MDNSGVQCYSDQFIRLANRLGWNLEGELAIFHFKAGLPRWLVEQLTTAEVARGGSLSVDILAKMALQLEAVKKQHSEEFEIIKTRKEVNNKAIRRSNGAEREKYKPILKCHRCGKPGHKAMDCYTKIPKEKFDKKSENTIMKPNTVPFSFQKSTSTNSGGYNTCFKCGKSGHSTKDCKQERIENKREIRAIKISNRKYKDAKKSLEVKVSRIPTNNTISVQKRNAKDQEFTNEPAEGIHTPCIINGLKITALVDPGAMISFIDRDLVLNNGWKIHPCSGSIKQAMTGSEIPRIGEVRDLELLNGSKELQVTLEVGNLSGGEKLIIGLNLFGLLGYQIRNIPILLPSADNIKPDGENVLNKKDKIRDINAELKEHGIAEDGIAEEWKSIIIDNMNLPISSTCLLPESELSINTGDNKPVWIRQYPIPYGLQEKVEKRVEEWKNNGWITLAPSNCQWNLPLLAAPKASADGGPSEDIRLCLDGRGINAVIVDQPDSNLPSIREVIDRLGPDIKWITTLDLADNYHQFKIKEEDCVKTAFMSGGRHWMFKVAPFGLKILTGHVQRLMEKHLGPTGKVPFQDDIAIASSDIKSHIQDVKEVLDILTYKLGLRLRMKKCKFFKTEARILGHRITRTGIEMDPAKVKSILEWPKPKDGKALQRFMGAANFHRDFFHEFAKIAAPLEECRQQKTIEWTPLREEAFKKLKEMFGSRIQLNHVNWNKKIYLTTDACQTGIGAWLGQKDKDGNIQPFVCASKKLTPTQQRWSATKRELYGLMWSMQKFHNYLYGRNFIARVDHKPLVNLVTNKMTLIMQGWIDNILLYDFTTEYLPGDKNELADALSRKDELGDHSTLEIRGISMEEKEMLSETDKKLLWEAEKRGLEMPNKQKQEQLVKEQHALGHFGVESCCQRIQQNGYWWPRMRQDIKREQQSCVKCTRFDVVAEGFHPSKSIMADKPWDHLEIDLIGPLPTSENKCTYILTIVDVCTSYTVLRALKSKEAEVVARKLWEVFTDYGTPKILQSDNGLEFVNQVVNAMTTLYGIEPRLSAAYNPRTNGLVERRNKDISLALKKFMEGNYGGWDDWLPLVQISLNQAIGRRTNSSAFELMFNRQFNGLGDFSEVTQVDDVDSIIHKHQDSWKLFRDAVLPGLKTRVAQVKREQREKMNLRKQKESVLPGQEVWIKDVTRGSKWDAVYEGPYTVLCQHKGGTYSLLDTMGEILPRRVPISQMKTVDCVIDSKASGGSVESTTTSNNKEIHQMDKGETVNKKNDHFVIEKVINHRNNKGTLDYLVKWKGYGPEDNSWVPVEDFDGLAEIQKYWRMKNKAKDEGKRAGKNLKSTNSVEPKPRRSNRIPNRGNKYVSRPSRG